MPLDGSAFACESMELSPTALVGSALTFETKEPSSATPDGTPPIWDNKELTKPDGSADAPTFEGRAPI
jgi:hypothetical protein